MTLELKRDGLPDYPVPPSPMGDVVDESWEVEPATVKQRIEGNDPDFLLLDCRKPNELEIAKIEPSLFIQMQTMPDRVDELMQYKDRDVVVYCHHGRRSLRAASFLRHLGFDRVMSMAGGIDRWSEEIDPDMASY
jgi:adenylyltransferase/sulfurtransferase